jgi:hypothetical protein
VAVIAFGAQCDDLGARLTSAGRAETCNESACASDKREDNGGVFRRIVAAGLRAQRESRDKQQDKCGGEQCFLHS